MIHNIKILNENTQDSFKSYAQILNYWIYYIYNRNLYQNILINIEILIKSYELLS